MVIAGAEDEEYQLTIDDVDSSLVFMYTPMTKEGTKGEPQYSITEFIKAGMQKLAFNMHTLFHVIHVCILPICALLCYSDICLAIASRVISDQPADMSPAP